MPEKDILNHIHVQPSLVAAMQAKQDARLTELVKQQFANSQTLRNADFDVMTIRGVVILRGVTRFQSLSWRRRKPRGKSPASLPFIRGMSESRRGMSEHIFVDQKEFPFLNPCIPGFGRSSPTLISTQFRAYVVESIDRANRRRGDKAGLAVVCLCRDGLAVANNGHRGPADIAPDRRPLPQKVPPCRC